MAFVKHRSKQLIVPYFCFFIIFYAFWLFVGRRMSLPEEQALPLYVPLLEYLYGRPVSVNMPLWFIACLFAMQCIFYWFKYLNRSIAILILFLLPFLPLLIDMSHSPWMLDGVCDAIPFYGIACLFKREFLLFIENKKRFLFGFTSLIISILFFIAMKNITNEYLNIPFYLIFNFSLILLVVTVIKTMTDKFGIHPLIKYMVPNTIIILACHTYIIRLADIFITRILNLSPNFYDGNLMFKISLTIFTMVLMLVPIYVINRYFPFIVGKGRLFESKTQK